MIGVTENSFVNYEENWMTIRGETLTYFKKLVNFEEKGTTLS